MSEDASSGPQPPTAPGERALPAAQSSGFWRTALGSLLLFALTFGVYSAAPVRQVSDSKYCLAPSFALLEHGTLRVDDYFERRPPRDWGFVRTNGDEHQIEVLNDHLYYFFPPGSAVLSAPFVAVARAFGVRSRDANGAYDVAVDEWLQCLIAAIVTAATVVVLHRAARWLLPERASAVLALALAFATPLLSTASRALWSDTWGCLIGAMAAAVWLRAIARGTRPNSLLLGTLLAWLFVTRPQSASLIAALLLLLLWRDRRTFFATAAVAGAWFGAFVVWSLVELGQPLPTYFRSNRLGTGEIGPALLGLLVSPGRGLLVFVPAVPVLLLAGLRHHRWLRDRPLVVAITLGIALNFVTVASYTHWWGGVSYGPRLTTGVFPWLGLVAVLVLDAARRRADLGRAERIAWGAAWAVTLSVSVAMHAQGAFAHSTWMWNALPESVDARPARLWDWSYPQFLAAALPAPHTSVELPEQATVPFADPRLSPGLDDGWGAPEAHGRWTVAASAALHLKAPTGPRRTLRLVVQPHLAPGRASQRVVVERDGQVVGDYVLTESAPTSLYVPLLAASARDRTTILLRLPDSEPPPPVAGRPLDTRALGVFCSQCQLVPD
ncbi:MAG: glycosyltransferase family 39 protein [Planctomycetes bacterium]|nr:glycosyltransferase family 39 protein [Planctomycetota bacterium]